MWKHDVLHNISMPKTCVYCIIYYTLHTYTYYTIHFLHLGLTRCPFAIRARFIPSESFGSHLDSSEDVQFSIEIAVKFKCEYNFVCFYAFVCL